MTRYHARALVLAIAVTLIGSVVSASSASADPFDGKVVTSDKRIPTSAKSKREYFRKLRKQSKSEFWEDTKRKKWKIHFAAFFKRPLNDLEVTIKIYDATEKQKRMVTAFEQFLGGRGQRNLISHVVLDRDTFGVNRSLVMVVENRGRTLAKGKFKIRGEVEKYSGEVEFSAEEAAAGEQPDAQ